MAKICFYCGRELQSSEKCTCREGRAAAAQNAGTGTGSTQNAGASTGPTQNAGSGTGPAQNAGSGRARSTGPQNTGNGKARTTNFTSAASGNKRSTARPGGGFFRKVKDAYRNFTQSIIRPSQTARPIRSSRLQTLRDQVRILFPTFSVIIKSASEYVIHPAARIRREALKSSRRSSIPVILVLSLLSGLLGMMFTQAGSPLFDSIMVLVLGANTSLLFVQPYLSMIGFSVLTLVLILTMAICFFLGAWLTKHRVTFRKVLDVLSISFIYQIIIESVMLLSMMLGSRGSLTMVLFGFLLMSVAQYVAFRNALSLKEDTVFLLLIFVYSSCYVLFLSIFDLVTLLVVRI